MAFLQLLILSAVMFLSTFLLGSLPLTLSSALAPHRFHQLSIFSVGLLVGAALTIVIPEGVQAIYSSTPNSKLTLPPHNSLPQPDNHHHSAIGLALMGGFMLMFLIDQASIMSHSFHTRPKHSSSPLLKSATPLSLQSRALLSEHEHWQEDGLDLEPGPSDQAEAETETETHPAPRSVQDLEHDSDRPGLTTAQPAAKLPLTHTLSTTIGLLTHSLTDGIALGASSTLVAHQVAGNGSDTGHGNGTRRMSLNLIIFLAIMVHKAPAAFGLVAVLMAEGLPKALVRRILVAFSLAAPLSSILTFAGFAAVHRIRFGPGQDDKTSGEDNGSLQWWIGVTLLFSGGTFLFVATHALQDSTSGLSTQPLNSTGPTKRSPSSSCSNNLSLTNSSSSSSTDQHSRGPLMTRCQSSDGDDKDWNKVEVGPILTCCLMGLGMISPWLLTQIIGGHSHGHSSPS